MRRLSCESTRPASLDYFWLADNPPGTRTNSSHMSALHLLAPTESNSRQRLTLVVSGSLALPRPLIGGLAPSCSCSDPTPRIRWAQLGNRDSCGLAIGQLGRTIIEPHDTNIELPWRHRGVGLYRGWPGGGKPVTSNLGRSSFSALGSITVFWKCAIFQMPSRLTIVNEALVFAAVNHG